MSRIFAPQVGDAAAAAREPLSPTTDSPSPTHAGVVQRKVMHRALQRRATRDAAGHDPTGTASAGFSSGGGELPHRKAIESSYGVDLSGVKAHTGSAAGAACESLGAEAYAMGNQVAFASSSPSLHVAAHEAAHVLQQAQGVHLSSKMGSVGDSYEQAADAAADRVVAGQSAKDLVPQSGALPSSGPVQCYHQDRNARAADDGQMMVLQESTIGGQTAYATESLIHTAGAALKQATSVITLAPGNMKAKASDDKGNKHDVVDVVPTNTENGTSDTGMELWADCGRASKTVSGQDGGTGQGNAAPVARYKKDGETKTGDNSEWMDIQKAQMFVDLFTTKNPKWQFWKSRYSTRLDVTTINAKLDEYKRTKKAWIAEKDENAKKPLQAQMSKLSSELDVLSRKEYDKLSAEDKLEFDKEAGINRFADPEIGESFHISTGGKDHAKKPKGVGTWNFHWGGVVMKSGGDTMTLENYSISDYGAQNTDWAFQLYGVGKEGQSFHDEHKDGHRQHGDAPTTMVATRPKK